MSLEDPSGRELYFKGTIEPAVERFFVDLLRPDLVVLDIGANVGLYTAIAAHRLGSSGAIHSFEPAPETVVRLRDSVALTKPVAEVNINQVEVTEDDGTELSLWTSDSAAGKGLASLVREHRWGAFGRRVPVQGTSLDTYVEKNRIARVDIIKMRRRRQRAGSTEGGRKTLVSTMWW